MHEWTKHVDNYLQALIMLEGRGEPNRDCCPLCQIQGNQGWFRCLSCSNLGLVCQNCIISTHQYSPLHRIEVQLFSQPIHYH